MSPWAYLITWQQVTFFGKMGHFTLPLKYNEQMPQGPDELRFENSPDSTVFTGAGLILQTGNT